jgi:hypothetical protein
LRCGRALAISLCMSALVLRTGIASEVAVQHELKSRKTKMRALQYLVKWVHVCMYLCHTLKSLGIIRNS